MSLSVLDPKQLNRIESVHRGFLYQHLYAVACLLSAQASGVQNVVVEADEDVQLHTATSPIYVQIKTRGAPLIPSDIEGALSRFEMLRHEHSSAKRAGSPRFAIVSNVPPGPALQQRMAEEAWPSDTQLIYPGKTDGSGLLPTAQPDLAAAFSQCCSLASSLPFAKLVPETLVLKVAATVMAAAAGVAPYSDHTFAVDANPELFEQIIIQLQEFPSPPPIYRPQQGEPALISEIPVRLITGFSGAGKTAWVAQSALHSSGDLAYFDVGDAAGSAVAIPLTRELAGRFLGTSGGGLGDIFLPGASGLEMLMALAKTLRERNIAPVVVIDNAHRLAPDHFLAIAKRSPEMRYVLLAQPGTTTRELEASLGIAGETLSGWTPDTIASDATDLGCSATPQSAQQLLDLTGGLPLYVQNAIAITAKEYGGDLGAFCGDLGKQTHLVATAQEIILNRVFSSLDKRAQDVVAVLSIADVPLERDEVMSIVQIALSLDEAAAARIIRGLGSTGFVEHFGGDRTKIHDAIRLIGQARLHELGADVRRAAYVALKDVLRTAIVKRRDLAKFALLVRTYVETGDIKPVVFFGTDELFHELGMMEQIYDTLESVSTNDTIDADQRFSAADGLIFADLKARQLDKAARHLDLMVALAGRHKLDDADRLTLAMKQMLYAASIGDVASVIEKLSQTEKLLPDNPEHQRIFRYNAAHSLFQLGLYKECVDETTALIPEFFETLGFEPNGLIGRNPPQILALLKGKGDQTDNLKHLADTFDLHACALNKAGISAGLARIHALKLYATIGAVTSVIRLGQDLADEFVSRRDYIGARQVLEQHVMPDIAQLKLASHVIPVRAQYAVVLAYCGDFKAAEREMASLAAYEPGMSPEQKAEWAGQRRFIEKLRRRPPAPQWQAPAWLNDSTVRPKPSALAEPAVKMGRNERCHCGSGLKFKRCHGRSM